MANSVEGLKPNHVAVVDNLGNTEEISDNDSLAGLSSTQLAARRNLEQYLSKKAQDMLETVLGPGQAIVRVSAEVNYDTITRTEEKFDPDGQVVRTQTKNDENNDTATAQNTDAGRHQRQHRDGDQLSGLGRAGQQQQESQDHLHH